MNRYTFLITAFFILVSCDTSLDEHPSSERKSKFIEILKILKDNNVDSIRKYVINALPSDSLNYNSSIEAAQRIITISNGKQMIDSIKLMDSVFYDKDTLYTYRLNFYNPSNVFVGYIEMSFLGDDKQRIGNLNAIDNIEDTTTMSW